MVKDYLKWNTRGAVEDEVVFVSGHPGGKTARDDTYPERINRFKRELAALLASQLPLIYQETSGFFRPPSRRARRRMKLLHL